MEQAEKQRTSQEKQQQSVKRMSLMSLVSFYGAAVFGMGTIINNIRQKFHHNFVLGYGETRTPFTGIVEKYNGDQFLPRTDCKSRPGLFDTLSIDREKGRITAEEFLTKRDTLRHAFKTEINNMLVNDYGVPATKSKLEDWTVGTWKRWKLMGNTSRVDASLGFASVTAFSVAAISLLHHNRRMLERVEKDIDNASQNRDR